MYWNGFKGETLSVKPHRKASNHWPTVVKFVGLVFILLLLSRTNFLFHCLFCSGLFLTLKSDLNQMSSNLTHIFKTLVYFFARIDSTVLLSIWVLNPTHQSDWLKYFILRFQPIRTMDLIWNSETCSAQSSWLPQKIDCMCCSCWLLGITELQINILAFYKIMLSQHRDSVLLISIITDGLLISVVLLPAWRSNG